MTSANDIQISGTHYKQYGDLQPWDVVATWNLGYFEGNALKYISRWKDKGGVTDLKKAIHYLEKLIEVTEAQEAPKTLNEQIYPNIAALDALAAQAMQVLRNHFNSKETK